MRIIFPLELQQERRLQGITQQQLAKKANVSQSLIAKIERGLVDPSFSSVVKLSQALQDDYIVAKDLMQTKIYWSTGDKKKDLALMKKHGVSQLVRSSTTIISEKSMLTNKEYENIITIPPETPKKVVEQLLQQGPLLVIEEEKVQGIITVTDLL